MTRLDGAGAGATMRSLLAVVLLAAAAPPAGAATVTAYFYDSNCNRYGCASTTNVLEFTADPGEANRLTVTLTADAITFVDAAAAVRWIPGEAGTRARPDACSQVDEHTVRCRPETPTIDLGDGDDEAGGDLGRISGGPGADRLNGGPLAEVLAGGGGADALSGGSGNDTLDGGDDANADRLDGGAGVDTADYSARRSPVRIDLGGGTSGAAGEDDRISAIEAARGGRAADTLVGGSGADTLDGGRGEDRLSGGAGGDRLLGGAGADRLAGGDGDDRIDPGHRDEFAEDLEGGTGELDDRDPDRHGDRVACGRGRDRVTWLSARDRVQRACERIVFEDARGEYDELDSETYLAAPVRVTGAGVVVRVGCVSGTCQGVDVAVVVRGRTRGRSRRRDIPAARTRRLFVPARGLPGSFEIVVRATQGRGAVRLTR